MEMQISEEALNDAPDLLGQIQRRQANAFIAKERAALAAVSSWELAWSTYLPTEDDDPADWEPYLTRLVDLR